MSMGITSALKLQEGSIQELSKLPQQQLVKMVQMGQLSMNLLPVVLNEKAQTAKAVANMQAAAQPQPPSVMEQNMMANAQADAQQQRQTGIANLPMQEGTFTAAGGGIVAFDDGGKVTGITPEFLAETGLSEADFGGSSDEGSMYDKEVRAAIARRAPYLELTPEQKALQDYYANLEERSKADTQRNLWGRLAQAGLGILGETSPYALANIGKGSKEPLAGAMSDIAAQNKAKAEALKARAELADIRRKGNLEGVTAGENLAQKKLERLIAAGKPTDMRNYINTYVAAQKELIAAGVREPTSDAALGLEANQDYLKRYGEAATRAQAAATSAAASATQAGTTLAKEQEKAWERVKNTDADVARALAKARQKDKQTGDGTGNANQQAVKDAWIEKNFPGGKVEGPGSATPPTAAPKTSKTSASFSGSMMALPMPGAEKDLKVGQLYNTMRGPAVWDGKKFLAK